MIRFKSLVVAALFVGACAGDAGPRGEGGKPGASSLVRLDELDEGGACERGGVAINSGIDADADGELADSEVILTRYSCNGLGDAGDKGDKGGAGEATRVRLEPVAPGEHCEFGGTAVFENEAAPPEYVCNGYGAAETSVWVGDYTVATSVDALVLRGIRHITGNLLITGVNAASLTLASIEQVDGVVAVTENDTLVDVTLSSLRFVGSAFGISSNTSVKSVKLPLLETIVGEETMGMALMVSGNDALDSLVFPRLSTVEKSVVVVNNPVLATFELPMLETVGGGFGVQATAITSLESRALSSVGGDLTLQGNTALTSVSLPALTTVDGDIQMMNNPALLSVSLASESVLTVGGYVGIMRNDVLDSVSLPGLAEAGSLGIYENVALESVSVASNTRLVLNASMAIKENASLESVWLPGLAEVGEDLVINQNPMLETLVVSELVSVGRMLEMFADNALASLDLPALQTVGGGFRVGGLPSLTLLTAPELESVGDEFFVAGNPQLPQCQVTAIYEALASEPLTYMAGGNDDAATCD